MSLLIVLALSAVVILLALRNWRAALLVVLLVGVLADPLRKLTPGVPSWFIVWAPALYLCTVAIAILARNTAGLGRIYLGKRAIRSAWAFFAVIVALHIVIALVRWGNPVVPIFGILFYAAPVAAMLLGYALADSEHSLLRFLKTYLWLFTPAALTVYLSPGFQDDWPVLRDVGTFTGVEMIIYDVGTVLKSYSGIFRTGEIAAWHAATAASLLVIMSIVDRNPVRRMVYILLIIVLVGAIVYTGRRKMLMSLSLFLLSLWALTTWFRGRLGTVSVIVLLLGGGLMYTLTLLDPASEATLYVQRSSTVFGAVDDRAQTSLQLLKSAFYRSGVVGLGAGTASQGIGYAGVDVSSAVGGAGEAGVGKLVLELGLVGLLSVVAVLLLTVQQLLRGLRRLVRVSERLFTYQCAFLSMLFANVMTFTVATQVYGDYFVLLLLGTFAGFVLRFYWLGVTLPLRGEAVMFRAEDARRPGVGVSQSRGLLR